jgi:phosphate transport system substrate-binding protein
MSETRLRHSGVRAPLSFGLSFLLVAACTPEAPAATSTPTPIVLLTSGEAYASAMRLRQGFMDGASSSEEVEVRLVASNEVESALANGQADLALVMGNPDPSLWAAPIAQLPIRVVVNAANPLAEVSEDDLRDLFAGEISDWRSVGGASAAVRIVAQDAEHEVTDVFVRDMLRGGRIGGSARIAPAGWAAAEAVGEDLGAIGYMLCADMTSRVREIRIIESDSGAPLEPSLSLFAVAPGAPSGATIGFLLWAQSSAAQPFIMGECGE